MTKFLGWVKSLALIMAFFWLVVTAGVLQEFASDKVPEDAQKQGLSLPLADPWILVSLQRMSMHLMDGEVRVRSYDMGSGSGPPGRVGVVGKGTPLGEFTISKKLRRESILKYGSRFIAFEFPRMEDAELALDHGLLDRNDFDRIAEAHKNGFEPPTDTPLGGPIGIQGNYFFFHSRHFTDGSLALANGDLNELFEYVFPGMRVIVEGY
jgi:hypothetical protein